MSKIFVNGVAVKPEDFVALQNDPDYHLVSIAPLKYQSFHKGEVERHPNLQNHLETIGVIPVKIRDPEVAPEVEEDPIVVVPAPQAVMVNIKDSSAVADKTS